MSDESQLDAESISRNKKYTAEDHLRHLLKIGHAKTSPVIKKFVEENSLQAMLKSLE